MTRFALGSLAAALSLSGARAEAAPALVLPSTSAHVVANDAVETARATLLARDPSLTQVRLDHESTLRLTGGRSVVRFAQKHDGVPVLGRGATLLLDAAGAPTSLAAARIVRAPLTAATPSFSAARAARVAARLAHTEMRAADGRLAWLPNGSGARLVWTFYRAPAGLPFAPAIAIDAHDGSVVLAHSAVSFDRAATVHAINPVTTPEPISVVLESLASGATSLENSRIRVENCVDEGTLTGGKYPFHACVTKQLAVADALGDFPYQYSSDTAHEDEYAEVVMFYHASKAYDYFTGIGMPELEAQPLELVVNLRLPVGFAAFDWTSMSNPALPLEPYNNAFFATQNPFFDAFGPKGPGLWFGQGVFTDFAYDGDVVYHEFGHAMVDRTAKLVHYWLLDSQGASVSPGAMNEGLADFFSSAMTGDGKVGEYAAKNFEQLAGSPIRDLDNDHKCPTQLSGEVHVDSTLFSGALWSLRKTLDPVGKKALDSAVMTALTVAPSGDLAFEDMAQLIGTAIGISELGDGVRIAFDEELTMRGVLPQCSRILEYGDKPLLGPEARLGYSFASPGTYSVTLEKETPFVPGLVQIHKKIAPGTDRLSVSLQDVPANTPAWADGEPYDPALIVRFEASPIQFSYDGQVASSNAGEPISLGAMRYAEVEVPAGAKELYLMVVNRGDLDGRYTSVSIVEKSPSTNTGGSAGSAGAGGRAGSAGAGGSIQAEDDGLVPAGGCACRTTPASPSGSAAWLAVLALLGLRRRHR